MALNNPSKVPQPINYRAFTTPAQEIRLVRLCSTRSRHFSERLVSGELGHYHREKCPPYVALSYAWGESTSTDVLLLGGVLCRAPAVVVAALLRFQEDGAEKWIWIDQLCINQADELEKSIQVQMMKDIYHGATKVVVWLGAGGQDSAEVFAQLVKIRGAFSQNSITEFHKLHGGQVLDSIAPAFRRLCQKKYWTRLWVIQEYAVARELELVYGDASLNGDDMVAVLDLYASINGSSESSELEAMPNWETLRKDIIRAFEPPEASFMAGVISRREIYQHSSSTGGESLYRVLTTGLVLENDYNYPLTTDPRDRIFAFLHLANDSYDFSSFPDYTRTCEDVYTDVAAIMLRQGSIDILAYCEFPKVLTQLPTWVPDWSMPMKAPLTQHPSGIKFSACGRSYGIEKQNLIVLPSGQLQVDGVHVDVISDIGGLWAPDWLAPLEILKINSYLNEIRALCRCSSRIHEYLVDMAAACVAAAYCGELNLVEDLSVGEMCREALNYLSSPGYLRDIGSSSGSDSASVSYDQHWYLRSLRRLRPCRPFTTETGYVGLGPPNTTIGDSLCIFAGGKAPYIIRSGDSGGGLVGEAYVRGLMNGEGLRGSVKNSKFNLW
ncbi:HET-domain-containing protein [Thozetella sp. PMI_491]|nr:HET-domain-containing protein [Thozetella sp. PMI_491]